MSDETELDYVKVVVNGVDMVPREWVDNWYKLACERGDELIRLKQSLDRYGDLKSMAERAQAWTAVCNSLDEHRPGWNLVGLLPTGMGGAIKAIQDMVEEISKLKEMNHLQAELLRRDQLIIDDIKACIE